MLPPPNFKTPHFIPLKMSKIQLHGNLTAAIYATTNKKLLNMRRHLSVGANFEIPRFNPLKLLKPLILPPQNF